jgi:hypothetical protein
MAKLEDLKRGAAVRGILTDCLVTVVENGLDNGVHLSCHNSAARAFAGHGRQGRMRAASSSSVCRNRGFHSPRAFCRSARFVKRCRITPYKVYPSFGDLARITFRRLYLPFLRVCKPD